MTFNEYVEDNPNIDGHLKVGTEFNKTKISPVSYKDLFDDNGNAAGTQVSILIKKQAS